MKRIHEIFKSASVLVFTDQLIFSGSNFLLTFLMVRKLSISEFGIFSSILLITYFLVGISNAFIVQPFQILSAKNFSKKSLGFAFMASLVLISMFSLLVFFITLLPVPAIAFVKNNLSALIVFVSAYILQDFLRKILLTIDHIKIVLFIDTIFIIIFPLLGFEASLTLWKSLYIIGIVNIAASVPGIGYLIKNADFNLKNTSLLRYYFTEGKWLLSASVLQWLSGNFFTLAAGVYLGINALGALRLVQSFFGIINIILQTIENYYLPKTAQLYYQNKNQEKKELLLKIRKAIALLAIIIVCFFTFSDSLIIILGGEKYHQYGFVIKLISALYIVILYSYPTRISIRILEQNKAFFIGYCISFVFSVLSFHFFIKIRAALWRCSRISS